MGVLWGYVYHESHRAHKWECLVLACIEGAGVVGIKDEFRPVLLCGRQ